MLLKSIFTSFKGGVVDYDTPDDSQKRKRLINVQGTCMVNAKTMSRYNPENVAAVVQFLEHIRELLLLLQKDVNKKNTQHL